MAIEFECPECEATIRVKESAAGKTGRCPKCRVLLMVPDPADWEDEEDDLQEDDPGVDPEQAAEPEPAVEPEPEVEPEPPVIVTPPTIDDISNEAQEPEPAPEWIPPMVEPSAEEPAQDIPAHDEEPAEEEVSAIAPDPADAVAVTPEGESDTTITRTSAETPVGGATIHPEPSPTELLTTTPIGPSDIPFTGGETRATQMLRKRTRRRRDPMSTKQRITIASAVGGIVLVLGVGWWLYASTLPDLSGPIEGEQLARLTLEEVTAPLPTNDVSDAVINKVMGSFGSEGFPLKSEYISAVIYGGGDQLDISIEPGPRAVPVRVQLGESPDVQEALVEVEEKIISAKQEELREATADMFKSYAAYLEDGSPIKRLGEYRDDVALNAAVGTIGYAVEAIVQSTPFPCVYEDGEGYCYFFLPESINTFHIRGRKVLGQNEDAPLPVDFQVTLKDVAEPVTAGQAPAKDAAEAETKSEDGEDKAEETKPDNESGKETAKEEPEKMKGTEEKSAGEMESSKEET